MIALAVLIAASAAGPRQDPPAVAPAEAPAERADYGARFDEATYEGELRRLVARHSERVRLSELGTSRMGRRIALLSVGDAAADPDGQPAVLLTTDLTADAEGRPAGPEAALFALGDLLGRARRDPSLAELLGAVTLYVAPAPDPDGLWAGAERRTCRLERNFPTGWQASDAIECPQGPYPCSEPETRELARFFAQRSNVAALAVLMRTASGTTPSVEGADAVCARVAHAAGLDALRLAAAQRAAEAEPGSLAAFARARQGAFVLALDPWRDPEPSQAPRDLLERYAGLSAALEALLRELPRLSARVVRSEQLREKLWLVEVDLSVAGLLPTACVEERRRSPASVWLDVEGARVARIGLRASGAPVGNLEVPRGRTWRVGHLEGGASVRLYLAVDAQAGASLSLSFRSLRGGRADALVPL